MEFPIFDADQHYYEPEDAFTRYASKSMLDEHLVRWVTEGDGKRRRILFAGKETVIGNPTFNPIAAPGIYYETLRNLEIGKGPSSADFGTLQPISPEYRDRDLRLKTLDAQGIAAAMMFPTLGVTVEGLVADRADMLYACFHAFNRWMDDDWGFGDRGRIYAAPYISLLDVDLAVEELDWVLSKGARVITMRPGAAYGRSPGDPHFDPFWARINEAGVLVAYHQFKAQSLASAAYHQQWAAPPHPVLAEHALLGQVIAGYDSAIMDTLSALILHNVFGRFPKVRVASIEMGARWVSYFMGRLDHAGTSMTRRVSAFGQSLPGMPSEVFQRHVWVAPFPEEDFAQAGRAIGADHILLGSDWPHPESTPAPRDVLQRLESFSSAEIKRIAHDNMAELVAA